MKSQQDIFVLTIHPEPPGQDEYGRDCMYRMRGFLKVMLRQFGWRCMSVRPMSPDDQDENGDDRREISQPSKRRM